MTQRQIDWRGLTGTRYTIGMESKMRMNWIKGISSKFQEVTNYNKQLKKIREFNGQNIVRITTKMNIQVWIERRLIIISDLENSYINIYCFNDTDYQTGIILHKGKKALVNLICNPQKGMYIEFTCFIFLLSNLS